MCSTLAVANTIDASSPSGLEAKTLLHFVAHATALRRTEPRAFARFWSLADVPLTSSEEASCSQVANALQRAELSEYGLLGLEMVRALFRKSKANQFAVMEPPTEPPTAQGIGGATVGDRPRGYGCFPSLSLANHGCLPTMARFDHFCGHGSGCSHGADASCIHGQEKYACAAPPGARVGSLAAASKAELARPPHSLAMRFVAMHGLPPGSELLHAYMLLADDYTDRQVVICRL